MRKVALITGASGGIGRSLCRVFEKAGWRVVASDVSQELPLGDTEFVQMDLNRLCLERGYRMDRIAVISRAVGKHLDCLINNAAFQDVSSVEELSVESWARTLNVNLSAPFLLVQAFIEMLDAAEGSVLNIGSIHASLTKPGFTAYASSKSGLIGLTRSLAVELGSRIRVNAISPAAISTPMLLSGLNERQESIGYLSEYHPANRIGEPDDLARLAYLIADSQLKFLNGSIIGFDGGIASRLHDPG